MAIPLQAPYLVTTDRDKTLAELRQRLAELLDIRRDVEQALGVHALIDQTITALDRATAEPMDRAIEAFNADPTPGLRAQVLHRLTAEYKTTKWTRRMLFELLVACEWDEDEARRMLEGMANG